MIPLPKCQDWTLFTVRNKLFASIMLSTTVIFSGVLLVNMGTSPAEAVSGFISLVKILFCMPLHLGW